MSVDAIIILTAAHLRNAKLFQQLELKRDRSMIRRKLIGHLELLDSFLHIALITPELGQGLMRRNLLIVPRRHPLISRSAKVALQIPKLAGERLHSGLAVASKILLIIRLLEALKQLHGLKEAANFSGVS